ncbi:hypothetical protein B0T22DRAFT_514426 [Podospora appendiculata]|uniref:Uncharacterized protein n=1 Tax=Podospora appendiculata TaxID=314037 RepID=A0AAE0XBX3_9PEZI|nr:hypothetical protein B0T22DRAFT_514426 [Podospora appendiculata]
MCSGLLTSWVVHVFGDEEATSSRWTMANEADRLSVPRAIRRKLHHKEAIATNVPDFDQWLSPIIVEKRTNNENDFWAPKEFRDPTKIPAKPLNPGQPEQSEPESESEEPSTTHFKDRCHAIRSIFPPAPGDSSLSDELPQSVYLLEGNDPVKSCEIARTLVLARSSVIVQHFVKEVLGLTVAASLGLEQFTDFDFKKLEEKPWTEQWRNNFFDLWSLQEELEYLKFELAKNRRVIERLGDSANSDILVEIQESQRYARDLLTRTTNSYFEAANASGALYANIQAVSCADLWAVSVSLAILLALFFMTNIWANTVECYHDVRGAPWGQTSTEKKSEARKKRAQEREDWLQKAAIRRNPFRAQKQGAAGA